MEFWQTIRGYEDYDVSTLGRVRSWKRGDVPRVLKPFADTAGYLRVSLFTYGAHTRTAKAIHWLVRDAFLRPLKEGEVTDHVNRDIKDNRLVNLRIASMSQNVWNSGVNKNKRFKGVTLSSRKTAYVARIVYKRELMHLGSYKTPEEAAVVYNHYAKKLFGEYAWLNDVDSSLDFEDVERIKTRGPNLDLPKGVSKISNSNRYASRITKDKKALHLGTFDTIEEASEAYQNKRKELFNN